MDKNTRLTIIIGCIVTFIIVPLATMGILTLLNPKPQETNTNQDISNLPNRSNDELSKAIASQQESLAQSDGEPIFAIVNVNKSQKGWYIVTIRELEDTDGENPAKVLLQDTGGDNGLKVLLGPGTQFPTDVTQPLGIPSSVVEELNK